MNQNWNPNGAPPNDGTANLVFTGTIRPTPEANGGAWSVNSITFDTFAGAFTLIGNGVAVQGAAVPYAIANNSSYTATITNALTLGAAQTWNANTADLVFSGTVALGANTLTLTGSADMSASGAISGTGALVKTGTGALTLSGANSYTGGTTITNGTLQGNSTSLVGNIVNSGAVVFDQSASGTFAGTISGAGSFTKQNTGALTLSNANTFTGATNLTGGTLVLGTANALSSATEVTIANSATLQLAGGAQTIGSFAGAGTINLGSNTLTSGGSNASTTYSGTISGTGALVKNGAGTLTLDGANNYSGGTTVNTGTLQVTSASLPGNVTLASSGTALVFDQATAGTYAGVISGAGSFTKQNSGTLTLTGTSTFTGPTNVNGGTLSLGTANALADTTVLTVASGATFQLGAANETIGSLAGAGNVNLGAFTLTAGGTNANTTFSGAITGTGGLVKNGSGTFTLSGANSYSGGTTVNGGTLQGTNSSLQGNIALANNSSVAFDQSTSGTYAGAISGAGSLTKANTGTLTLSGVSNYNGTTNVTGGTLALGVNNALPAASNLTLSAGTTLDLGGKSVQIGTLNYTTAIVDFGTTAVANSLLFLGGGGASGTLTINNFDAAADKLAFATTTTVDAGYLAGVYFYGIGAGVFGATNQAIAGYAGTWNLIVPNTAAFRVWDGGGGANVAWSKNTNWDSNNAIVSGTSLRVEMAGSTNVINTVDANVTLNTLRFAAAGTTGAFTINASAGAALTFGGSVPSIIQLAANAQTINAPLVFNSTTVIETSGAGTLTLAGGISGAAGGINKVGVNTLVLAGANTYDGVTTINAGTLIAQNSSALGSTAGGTTVSSGATLQLENNISVGGEALVLNGALRNAAGANSYAGAISGAGTVTVDGGTLSLGGSSANTYTGVTTVNSGTLELNKSGSVTALAGNLVIGNGTGTATARLLASNQIADTSAVTLNAAGTPVFNLNGFSETVGSIASTNTAAAIQLGAGALTTGGDNSSTTFAGVISGTGGALTKQGSGTFTLTGANTYTGATTIAAGTLVARNATALGTTAGGTTVNSGATLQLENNIAVGAEALTLNGTLRNASGTNSYAGAISGTGNLAVDGGTLSLGGTSANTFTGTTTIGSGSLDLNKTAGVTAIAGNLAIGNGTGSASARLLASNQISDTASVTLHASGSPTLNLNSYSETIGSLASTNSGAAVQLGAGTLTTGGNNASTTFAGVISGTGSLVKEGTGTFTLSGTNTFTGTTSVNAGKLALGASNALSASSNLTLATDATFSLGGTSSQRLNLLSFTNATVDFGATGTANYLLLSNVGSATGVLTVSNWTSGSDVFGVATNTVSQAFLDSVYFSGINVGVGAVISTTTTFVPGYGNFYTLTPIPTFTWSGAQNTGNASDLDNWSKGNNWVGGIAPGIGAVKSLVLAGNVRTTNDMDGAYQVKGMLFRSDAGAFTINSSTGDTLTLGGAGLINESANTQTLNVAIALSAAQTWNADSGNIAITGATLLNGVNTLTIDGGFNTTISAAIDAGAGGLVKNGAGVLTLSGANAFTGGLTINAGTVAVGSGSNLGAAGGTVTFGGGMLRTTAAITATQAMTLNAGGGTVDTNGFNSTWSGAIGGAGGLTKTGAGTLTLAGSNTYAGGTTVSAGTLQGTTTSVQGNILNNAAVIFDQSGSGTYAGAMSGSGSLTKQNTGTLLLTGANSYSGGTTVSGGTLRGDTTSLQGNIAVTTAGATLVFDQNTSGTYNGVASGVGSLTKLGTATLTLTGSNSIATVGINAGTLRLGANNTLGSTTALTISSGATFDVNGVTQTIGALAGAGTVSLGGGALQVGNGNVSSTFAGNISGAGIVEKIGGGILTFNASFSFAGELKLTGGTVNLAGINLTVGTLRITGNTVLDFGNSVASVLTATNVIIENGAVLTINNWVNAQDYFYATGAFYGFNTTTLATTPAGFDIRGVAPQNQISFTGFGAPSTGWLPYDHQITPAPEPSTYGAMLISLVISVFGYRRWRGEGKVGRLLRR